MAKYEWTEEQRKAQAERIRAQKPWEKSTGPNTETGKERVSFNAFKHGNYSENAYEMRAALKAQNDALEHIEAILRLSKYLK